MADRFGARHNRGITAAQAAALLVAVSLTAPALASRIPCTEAVNTQPGSDVNVLITETVGHNLPASPINNPVSEKDLAAASVLLGPRAEEAIREAFNEADSAIPASLSAAPAAPAMSPPLAGTDPATKPETKAKTLESAGEHPVSRMHTKLPGLSDVAMSRYKKQMFRRDI